MIQSLLGSVLLIGSHQPNLVSGVTLADTAARHVPEFKLDTSPEAVAAFNKLHPQKTPSQKDLAFKFIPASFTNTISKVGMFGTGPDHGSFKMARGCVHLPSRHLRWEAALAVLMPFGEVWGELNPDLQDISQATKCTLFSSPGKYWPKVRAQEHFSNKSLFSVLRDPYERTVALFREKAGGRHLEPFLDSCDLNGGVKLMLNEYLNGSQFDQACRLMPQAEYFDMPYGVTIPVDARRFPDSLHELLGAHGYENMRIDMDDVVNMEDTIRHPKGTCPEVWAGDLDDEARALVRKVYARDFDLICEKFKRCDSYEVSCLTQIPGLCPSRAVDSLTTATPSLALSSMPTYASSQL